MFLPFTSYIIGNKVDNYGRKIEYYYDFDDIEFWGLLYG